MTAVEWLEEKLKISIPEEMKVLRGLVVIAKEMEKEQIKSAFIQGDMFSVDYYDGINPTENNYYSETFKKENQ